MLMLIHNCYDNVHSLVVSYIISVIERSEIYIFTYWLILRYLFIKKKNLKFTKFLIIHYTAYRNLSEIFIFIFQSKLLINYLTHLWQLLNGGRLIQGRWQLDIPADKIWCTLFINHCFGYEYNFLLKKRLFCCTVPRWMCKSNPL